MERDSAIDTSRPFVSVKEAVAIFGDRILINESRNSPKPKDSPQSMGTPSPREFPREEEERGGAEHALKKLEAELSEAKEELRLLKKKETETEVAVAALNAELHRSMSRLAKAEAEAAARRLTGLEKGKEKRAAISPYSPTLAQIMSVAEDCHEGETRDSAAAKRTAMKMTMAKKKKRKPVVPLVWEFFPWRKTSADDIHKSLYDSSPHLFN